MRRRTLVLLALATAVGSAGLAAGGTAGALLGAELAGTEAAAGLPLGMLVVGQAATAVLVSRRTVRGGRGRSLSEGYVLGALGAVLVILAAVAGSFAALLAGSAVLGAGNTAVFMTRYAAAEAGGDGARGKALGAVFFATALGAVASPGLLGPGGELARGVGLPPLAGIYVLAIPCFVLAALLLRGASDPAVPYLGRGAALLGPPRETPPRQAQGAAGRKVASTLLGARAADLHRSVCAVLVAEACNVGLEPLVDPSDPALTRSRLSWVQQNYVRDETLARANARLVDAQGAIPIVSAWGAGEVASMDGLRFVVPVGSVNAGSNPRYFGRGRGITYLNYVSDRSTGFHGIVVPGTLRDSLFLLDGLLEHRTSLDPREVTSDTAGYSDLVFGLFSLLGYQFSPRLADAGEARFWRVDRVADYGPLDGLSRRNRIRTGLIRDNWEDVLRVAGSLKLGTVRASDLVRVLQAGARSSELAKAIAEVGRIAKSLFLLSYVDDEAHRRRVLVQLNRHESRHYLARTIFHGDRGRVRKRYREGQEDQLSSLGLVLNAVALWNTIYLDRAVSHLEEHGAEIRDEDLARVSPLTHAHVRVLGRYHFRLDESLEGGGLRPLRDPNAPDELGPPAQY